MSSSFLPLSSSSSAVESSVGELDTAYALLWGWAGGGGEAVFDSLSVSLGSLPGWVSPLTELIVSYLAPYFTSTEYRPILLEPPFSSGCSSLVHSQYGGWPYLYLDEKWPVCFRCPASVRRPPAALRDVEVRRGRGRGRGGAGRRPMPVTPNTDPVPPMDFIVQLRKGDLPKSSARIHFPPHMSPNALFQLFYCRHCQPDYVDSGEWEDREPSAEAQSINPIRLVEPALSHAQPQPSTRSDLRPLRVISGWQAFNAVPDEWGRHLLDGPSDALGSLAKTLMSEIKISDYPRDRLDGFPVWDLSNFYRGCNGNKADWPWRAEQSTASDTRNTLYITCTARMRAFYQLMRLDMGDDNELWRVTITQCPDHLHHFHLSWSD